MKYERVDATLALDDSIGHVKLVSAAREKSLQRLGIQSVRDLLYHFPFRYLDMSRVETVSSSQINESCTIVGTVHEVVLKKPKPRLELVEIALVDASGLLMITCFRQPWLADRIKVDDTLAVSGTIEFSYGYKRMTNPFIETLSEETESLGVVIPVHHSTEKLSAPWIRRLISNALEYSCGMLDPLSLELRTRYRLPSRQHALRAIHFPSNMEEARAARRRLAFEEVFLLELHLMQENLARLKGMKPHQHKVNGPRMHALQKAVPFELTEEQVHAKADILDVLADERCANHMVLGDVGTGKTILAAFALAAAADTAFQAVMMAPTEVLAQQYGRKLGPLFDQAGITWALLCGSTPPDQKELIISQLQTGAIEVIFGTQALLEDSVHFKHCSLVIIDEQQRFGVEQRAKLIEKAHVPDVIYLTATPIPRTMARALYGNMTLSYLRKKPHNTQAVKTFVHDTENIGYAYDAIRVALEQGRQAYVVCPLVGARTSTKKEGSETELYEEDSLQIDIEDECFSEGNIKAATSEVDYLQKKVFPQYRVALLYGTMNHQEKQEVMDSFYKGEVDVLVSTTAIEVGVDVPNASVMVIRDADRFGLAQLHQLRGRVGRGSAPGSVYLISGTRSPLALKRLHAMETFDDGFELALHDLSLRKEGDILGNRQHGASLLKLIHVVRDGAIIEAAHAEAYALLEKDPELSDESHRALAREVRLLFSREEFADGVLA